MKFILIDAANQEVREVEHDGSLASLYELVQCRTVEAIRTPLFDMYVDEESLMTDTPPPIFMIDGYQYPVFGNALLHTVDHKGNTVPASISLDDAKRGVKWIGGLMKVGSHLLAQEIGSGKVIRIPDAEFGAAT